MQPDRGDPIQSKSFIRFFIFGMHSCVSCNRSDFLTIKSPISKRQNYWRSEQSKSKNNIDTRDVAIGKYTDQNQIRKPTKKLLSCSRQRYCEQLLK